MNTNEPPKEYKELVQDCYIAVMDQVKKKHKTISIGQFTTLMSQVITMHFYVATRPQEEIEDKRIVE